MGVFVFDVRRFQLLMGSRVGVAMMHQFFEQTLRAISTSQLARKPNRCRPPKANGEFMVAVKKFTKFLKADA